MKNKPPTSFLKEQKYFDSWRNFLYESAAPGTIVLEEQELGRSTFHAINREFDKTNVENALNTIAEELSKIQADHMLAAELVNIFDKLGITEETFERTRGAVSRGLGNIEQEEAPVPGLS